MAINTARPLTRPAAVACSRRSMADRRATNGSLPGNPKRSSAERLTVLSLRIELFRQRHHRWPLGKLCGTDQLGIGKGLRIRIRALGRAGDDRWHPGIGVDQLGLHAQEMLDEEAGGIRV